MRALKIFEAYNFERGVDPQKALKIGKHRTIPKTFKDYDGEELTIEVDQENSFEIPSGLKVQLVFKEDPEIGKSADVYVDGDKNDFMVFRMTPADYEFQKQGEHSDPGYTNYGFPVARDEKHLEELKEKFAVWHVYSGDHERTSKDPFIAVARMIFFVY